MKLCEVIVLITIFDERLPQMTVWVEYTYNETLQLIETSEP